MKRALIQSVKVTPYTSEDAINREGFLSGILAVKVGSPSGSPTGMAVKLTITESDQSGTGYAPSRISWSVWATRPWTMRGRSPSPPTPQAASW